MNEILEGRHTTVLPPEEFDSAPGSAPVEDRQPRALDKLKAPDNGWVR